MLNGCGEFDEYANFNSNAIPVKRDEIHNLRGGKVSCMHCPLYFMFDAEPALIEKLVAEHRLQQLRVRSPEIREIEELVQREANWWQLGRPGEQDKVYWVRYISKRPEDESAFRLLVVQNAKAFFITSGNFDRAAYQVQ